MAFAKLTKTYLDQNRNPYVGYRVSVTLSDGNTPVKIYGDPYGQIPVTEDGMLTTDSQGMVVGYVPDNSMYTLRLLHPLSGAQLDESRNNDPQSIAVLADSLNGNEVAQVRSLISSGGVTGQTFIQFKEEGTNLGSPGTVDTINFVGAGVTAARSGNTVTVTFVSGTGSVTSVNGQPGPTVTLSYTDVGAAASGHTHSNATGGSAGFLSAADKTRLDGMASGATNTPLSSSTPADVGTSAIGVGTTAARADHVHAHGNQAGGSLHGNATGSVAGFMSAADKTKIDTVATNATNTPLSSTTPAAIGTAAIGVGTTAARADHVHAHGNQLGGTLHDGASQSVAGFMSATDKTKLDGVAAGATANSTDSFLRDRTNHTGFQAQSTITNLTTDLAAKLNASAVSAFGLTLVDDADQATARTTLGLGSAATQASSAFATATHTHVASDITNFSEAVDDRVAVLLAAGSGITLNYDDVNNVLTITSTGGGGGLSAPVANSSLATMPANTIKANNTGSAATPIDATVSQVKTMLGISTVDDTAFSNKQPLDSDLTAIAALTPANDDFIQRKGGVWTNRTPAQVAVDVGAASRTYRGVTASQAAMLALTANKNDWTIRSDLNNTPYELTATPASTLGNWVAIPDLVPVWTAINAKADFSATNLGTTLTGALTAFDMANQNWRSFYGTITGNVTIPDPVNPALGKKISLCLTQGGAGGFSMVFSSAWSFPGGQPSFVLAPSLAIRITAEYDGSAWRCDSPRNVRSLDLTAAHAWTSPQYYVPVALGATLTGALTIDASASGLVFEGTVTGNITGITVNNLQPGMQIYLRLKVGTAGVTLTLGSQWVAFGGPYAMPPSANDILIIYGTYTSDGNKIEYTAVSSVAGRIHVGTMTWSALQSAYANGGAALALLPVGSTCYVSDLGVGGLEVLAKGTVATPGTAVAWVPNGTRTMRTYMGTIAAPAATMAGATAAQNFTGMGITIPAGFLRVGMRFRVIAHLRRNGTTAVGTYTFRMGTLNSASDGIILSLGIANTDLIDTRVEFTVAVVALGTTGTTLSCLGYLGVNISNATAVSELAVNTTVPVYINPGVVTANAADSYRVITLTYEVIE